MLGALTSAHTGFKLGGRWELNKCIFHCVHYYYFFFIQCLALWALRGSIVKNAAGNDIRMRRTVWNK